MKATLIVLGIIAVLFGGTQIYTSMATDNSSAQPYTVISKEKLFEVRYYPSATMAMFKTNVKTYKELGSTGFKQLAGYIFGGNKEKKQIAMTSPVHMEMTDTFSSMSFVMPENYNKDNLPDPNSSEVIITTAPDEYVAAITFGGFASQETIKKQIAILQTALQEKNITYYGNFRYLGYNPPYQLFGRKNEIIVALNWDLNK